MTRQQTYTYQGGRRLLLSRLTSRFISRAKKEQLQQDHFHYLDPLSVHSWSVESNADRLDEDIRRARRLAPAYPYYIDADTGDEFIVTDRIFVRLRAGASADEVATRWNLQLVRHFTWRDYLFRVDPKTDVVDVVKDLTERGSDLVECVDHDINVRPQPDGLGLPRPLPAKQWYLFSSSTDRLVNNRALVDCEGAWATSGLGSRDIVVTVIDFGCDLEDLNFGKDKFAAWALLIDGELQTSIQLGDDKSSLMEPPTVHGTLCATLVAAGANAAGGLGAAPACRLLPVKWMLNGDIPFPRSLFIELIEFLRDRTSIITCSLHLGLKNYWPPVVRDAVAESAINGGPDGKGIIWVWSAGNRNTPIHYDSTTEVPTVIEPNGKALAVTDRAHEFVSSLAGLPGVLHVGAISSLGQRCHYSNYGSGLMLVAPSSNYATYGRLRVSGRNVSAPLGSRLYPMIGTSAAAPIVAGVAALVRSANPSLTALDTISILKRTADKDLDMTRYPSSSRPIDPEHDWDISPIAPFDDGRFRHTADPDGSWSPWFGFGKVNAQRAVAESLRRGNTRPPRPAKRPRAGGVP